ncbi:MAG: hypothetical protein GY943_35795, partial [Chloroflexi bacterium]|nr:hypothetical protein [Chloroflexota bacterium]
MLQLRLLGGIEIIEGERPLTHHLPQKAIALLVYLAVTKQPHSRARLAGLLWSEFTEQRARSNLRDALSVLRRHAAPYLNISRQSVAIMDGDVVQVDTAVFQHHLTCATKHPNRSLQQIGELETAVQQY